ncbi:E1-like protein-activating [Rhizodiscina lignyota]|uniref:Ubiquitin-like modifier-activating enzyme ATG7 n=1 Tax=Rhizodiscina lignyota TaxID=1504668 RepID=A0A9P4IPU2_9PEZI|nr:E1-like protein-activating [Rhizodiscina lignyota]
MSSVQYAPWTSDVELAFYASLANLKINHDMLDDSARKVRGLYEVRPSDKPERSSRMQIHGNALTTDEVPATFYRAEGIFKNVNTLEEYKNIDRSAVIEQAGRTIWDAIKDGTIYSCPSLLSSFSAISFADLKKYKFTYHFAYPAIHSDPPWKSATDEHGKLTSKETTALVDAVQTWRYGVDTRQHGFFLAKKVRKGALGGPATGEGSSSQDAEPQRPKTPQTPSIEELGFQWKIASLSSFEEGFFNDVEPEDRFISFADPSNFPQNPGWMLRNLLVLIRQRWELDDIQVLCYRDTHLKRDQANSIILHLQSAEAAPTEEMPKITGWERNESGKLTSRMVDLSEYMDPMRLADQAVDLNLKLIKWRIAPSIDLEVIKDTKCLLLGAGTLGSYVSRNLMGWGVRKITFVDNARVSFSNPVRQPLFDFKDCLEGGAKKAQRAADMLAEIYPGVEAEGHVMSVPMAGHPITDEERVKSEFELLKKLIDEHDTIFLLMDTRESRWLPTVMGKAAGKIVLNAALGFDTFVVMRHGLKSRGPEEEEMGCYFCNDVVAPADSLKDATLDQQCTVTRPGIAPIASALLVEMLVSILQHPLRAHAPATSGSNESAAFAMSDPESSEFKHPLGAVPHQIRGFLSSFSNLSINGKPYDCCSACSETIIRRYNEDGWDFVKRALNERGWVEEISGLAEVQRKAEEANDDLDWDEEEAEEGEGELI